MQPYIVCGLACVVKRWGSPSTLPPVTSDTIDPGLNLRIKGKDPLPAAPFNLSLHSHDTRITKLQPGQLFREHGVQCNRETSGGSVS